MEVGKAFVLIAETALTALVVTMLLNTEEILLAATDVVMWVIEIFILFYAVSAEINLVCLGVPSGKGTVKVMFLIFVLLLNETR